MASIKFSNTCTNPPLIHGTLKATFGILSQPKPLSVNNKARSKSVRSDLSMSPPSTVKKTRKAPVKDVLADSKVLG